MIVFVPEDIKLWVDTPHGESLVIYVQSFAQSNDIFTVANKETGKIRHYNSSQITLTKNYTDEIKIE